MPFELAYPFGSIKADTPYRLYAGIVDGDLAWVTPIGVSVDVPQATIENVELPLEFRPDLLKAAVTGTITGVGLDAAKDPEAYGTALIIRVNTGETIGFQLISPTGRRSRCRSRSRTTRPPSSPRRDYVSRGSIWDGTTLWNTDTSTPVLTKDNARNGVVMTVTAVPSPTPAPTAAPAAPTRRRPPTTGSRGCGCSSSGAGFSSSRSWWRARGARSVTRAATGPRRSGQARSARERS